MFGSIDSEHVPRQRNIVSRGAPSYTSKEQLNFHNGVALFGFRPLDLICCSNTFRLIHGRGGRSDRRSMLVGKFYGFTEMRKSKVDEKSLRSRVTTSNVVARHRPVNAGPVHLQINLP